MGSQLSSTGMSERSRWSGCVVNTDTVMEGWRVGKKLNIMLYARDFYVFFASRFRFNSVRLLLLLLLVIKQYRTFLSGAKIFFSQ